MTQPAPVRKAAVAPQRRDALLLSATLCAQWCYGSAVGVYANYPVLGLLAVAGLWLCFDFGRTQFKVALALLVYAAVSALTLGPGLDGQSINLMLWIVLVPVAYRWAQTLPLGLAGKALRQSNLLALALLSADMVLRFALPQTPDGTLEFIENNPDSLFYAYKFGGFMFAEANTFGLCALALFVSLRLSPPERIRSVASGWCFLLVCSSLSRTAVAAALLFEVGRRLPWMRKRLGFAAFLGYCLLINLLPVVAADMLPDDIDGSGLSKLAYLLLFANHLASADLLTLGFGAGLGNSIGTLDFYPHNFFIIAVVELGAVGTVALLWLFWWCLNRPGLRALLYVYPIAGLSYLFMLAAPALFLSPLVAAVLASRLSQRRRAARGPQQPAGRRGRLQLPPLAPT